MKIKRFLLFGYKMYYPGGGWQDFIHSYDTKEEGLIAYAEHNKGPRRHDCYELIDTATGEDLCP